MDGICGIIAENRIVDYTIDMIRNELQNAAEYAERGGLSGLAEQYRELGKPLQAGQYDAQ